MKRNPTKFKVEAKTDSSQKKSTWFSHDWFLGGKPLRDDVVGIDYNTLHITSSKYIIRLMKIFTKKTEFMNIVPPPFLNQNFKNFNIEPKFLNH